MSNFVVTNITPKLRIYISNKPPIIYFSPLGTKVTLIDTSSCLPSRQSRGWEMSESPEKQNNNLIRVYLYKLASKTTYDLFC